MPPSTKLPTEGGTRGAYANEFTGNGYSKPSGNDFAHEHKYELGHEFTLDDSDSIASGNDNDSEGVASTSFDESEMAKGSTASPGRLPDEVYEKTLEWWRAGVRRFLVKNLETESRWLARMQVS